jgi:hypothetical protein
MLRNVPANIPPVRRALLWVRRNQLQLKGGQGLIRVIQETEVHSALALLKGEFATKMGPLPQALFPDEKDDGCLTNTPNAQGIVGALSGQFR